MSVKIFLGLATHKGQSGKFEYLIDIPSNVKEITFGNQRTQIWPKVIK